MNALLRMPCWVVMVCLILTAHALKAQQPAYFMLGEEEFDGVQIYDVIQDLQSHYWFATDEGLVKHDGYTFEHTPCKDMGGGSVFGFVMDQSGTIFCHTLNHQILKIQNGECSIAYELKEEERAPDVHLCITPENALLVVARKALLIQPDGRLVRNPALRSYYYGAPFRTRQGSIICHTGNQDSLLVVKGHEFRYLPLQHSDGTPIGVLRFFRIRGAAYAIDVSGKKLYALDEEHYKLSTIGTKPFLQTTAHLRYYNENDQLWIAGPTAGVQLLTDPWDQQVAPVMYPQHLISSVFQDREGNILLSTFNNSVLVIPDMETPDAILIPGNPSVVELQPDADMGMLLGTATGQLLAAKHHGFEILSDAGTKPLEVIHAWPQHPLILFDDGKIKAYNKHTGKIHEIVQGSLKDAVAMDANTFYLALNTGIVKVVWDGKEGFRHEFIPALRIRTYAIENDPLTQTLYIATADGLKSLGQDESPQDITWQGKPIFASDLVCHDRIIFAATHAFGILPLIHGHIPQQIVPRIAGKPLTVSKLAIHQGKLYATTSAGFVGITVDGTVTSLVNRAHGFSSNKIFNFAFDRDHLWIAHSQGVQQLKLTQLLQENPKPQLSLAHIEINDIPLDHALLEERGEFESTQRKFRFELHTPTLRYRENMVYHYRLIGYETTWNTAGYEDNSIVYNALGPGSYKFIAKAANQGRMSNTVTYTFTISAPYYSQWWFILLSACIALLVITLVYRRQLILQRRKAWILNELNASKLTAIQSQMNPHFIFNALNSIQDLVLKGDVENSYSYITTFSNLVRSTLNYSDKDFIDFEQEIKLLDLYLSLEKLRFKHTLEYEILHDEKVEAIQLPPLLIQPFVENALVHGLFHREGIKRLKIQFDLQQETLICTITDNGIGREKSRAIRERQRAEHESFSGKAIRNRFEILSDVFKGEFGYHYEDLEDDSGKAVGTRVILKIPVKHRF
jgi:hypothetical protein